MDQGFNSQSSRKGIKVKQLQPGTEGPQPQRLVPKLALAAKGAKADRVVKPSRGGSTGTLARRLGCPRRKLQRATR